MFCCFTVELVLFLRSKVMNLHVWCTMWICKSLFFIYYIHNELTGCCAFLLNIYFSEIDFLLIKLAFSSAVSLSLSLFNHANTKTMPSHSVSIYTNIEMRVFRSLPAKERRLSLLVYRCRLNDQYVWMDVRDILMMSCLICLFDWMLVDK